MNFVIFSYPLFTDVTPYLILDELKTVDDIVENNKTRILFGDKMKND